MLVAIAELPVVQAVRRHFEIDGSKPSTHADIDALATRVKAEIGTFDRLFANAQLIAEVLSDTPKYQQVLTHAHVYIYTDAAVLVDTDTLKDRKTGALHGAPYKFTVVYVKRDGVWRAVAEQWVPIKKPA